MPAISKIRFTNLVYENGAKRYRDEIFRFDSHNGVILLENGGGKTVLVQALLQVVLPHAALAERKAKDTFSLENSPAHIAVEWIINEKPRRYALTVVTLFSSKEGMDSYKYVYEYESGDKNSLEGLPLVRQGSDGRLRPASKEEMYDYYLAMSRSSMNAHHFPSIREYQQYIEENFKIIISEWRSIARINSAEGEVEGFFEGCKTTAQLVDRLLIPIVEEAMAGSGSQDFVETFQKQREHFKKHSQLQERIEESQKANSQIGHYVDAFAFYHQAGQKMDNVRGQAKSLYRLALKEEQRVAQSMEHHQ
jgi:predicted ATPase